MKVMVNGVEIEIKGSSRLTYDVDKDTLSVDPIIREKRQYIKSDARDAISKVRTMKSAAEINYSSMSKDELKKKVIVVIKNGDQPMAQQFITLQCIGKGAKNRDRDYFSKLLNQMSEDGELIKNSSSGRARYSLP